MDVTDDPPPHYSPTRHPGILSTCFASEWDLSTWPIPDLSGVTVQVPFEVAVPRGVPTSPQAIDGQGQLPISQWGIYDALRYMHFPEHKEAAPLYAQGFDRFRSAALALVSYNRHISGDFTVSDTEDWPANFQGLVAESLLTDGHFFNSIRDFKNLAIKHFFSAVCSC
jgi:hypothetical protein